MTRLVFVNRVCWPSEEATAQLLRDLLEGLSKRGWDCHIVTATAGIADYTSPDGGSIRIHRLSSGDSLRPKGLIGKALGYRHFARATRRFLDTFLESGDYLVAMTDPPLIGRDVATIAKRRGVNLWHWTQDVYPEVAMALAPNPLVRGLLGRFRKPRNQAWREASRIVTIGEDMASLIKQQVGQDTPVSIVPNWYPQSREDIETRDYRHSWGIAENCLLVMYAGNLGRAHALTPLLELARRKRDTPRIHFIFVGDGAQRASLEKTVADENLGNVSFHPAVPREALDSLLEAADIHVVSMRTACRGTVLPSKFYGVMAAHRPCIFIGPTESDLAKTIVQQELGIACSPGNIAEAVRFLDELVTRPEARNSAKTRVKVFNDTLPKAEDAAVAWHQLLQAESGSPSKTTP